MMEAEAAFRLIGDVGFPIASAMGAGAFVFLTLKFILAGVDSNIRNLTGIIAALDNRVATMNHDILRIDLLISTALDVEPDIDRVARADGKQDARKD
jgi:hypothetical protein